MNYVLSLLFLLPYFCFAQEEPLKFDTKYYACEDQWIVFPKKKDKYTYVYGFIYLDEEAGFTFNLEGKLELNDAGQLMNVSKEPQQEETNVKIRLEPRTSLVAVLSAQQLKELKLPEKPEWLHFYKENEDELASLLARGYHYNHAGASQLALKDLEEAYKKQPTLEGLAFELAYAYNATEQYEKAVGVLEKALELDAKNYFFYRELGFAQVRLNQTKKAEQTYEKGIRLSNNAYQKSEMGINMTQAYFKLKDKKGFKKWAKITRRYAPKDAPFLKHIDYWEKELK